MLEYPAKLIKTKQISSHIYDYYFSKPSKFAFKPGQFISVRVADKTLRSYSIASENNDSNLRLIVDLSPMGVGCKYFSKLKLGDKINFIGPLGNMVLPDKLDPIDRVVFISTGTGIAPFLSILAYLNNVTYSGDVSLLHSEKYQENLVHFDFSNLNLSKKITLTREQSSIFLQGRVTTHLDKSYIAQKTLYYVCGNKDMVVNVCDWLLDSGIPASCIRKEIFY